MTTIDVPVLIVGGGPTGLAASIALSRCGVRSLLVDKHPATSNHPKATVVNVRTMELLRQWGLADRVAAAGIEAQRLRCVCWVTTLAGHEIGRIDLNAPGEQAVAARRITPALPVMCPQDVLEPILRQGAEDRPEAEVSYGTELVQLDVGDDGLTAQLRDTSRGTVTTVQAQYVLGCDGRASVVRQAVGIGLDGRPPLGDVLNIYLRADLRHLVEHRLAPLYWIVNPEATGVFITLDGADRWLLNIPYDSTVESVADYPLERCAHLARRAIGDPDVEVEVLRMHAWQMTRLVADRFRAGRVFLAGDAAHQFPPTGGHGMNSGIQDAHNLAWKLAAVLDGWAGPGLLDTYEQERRPVALELTAESTGNAAAMKGQMRPPVEVEHDTDEGQAIRDLIGASVTKQRGHFVSTGLVLGSAYPAGALVPDPDTGEALVADVERYVPTAAPGHRAPHVDLGGGRSTIDDYEATPVLLAAGDLAAWDVPPGVPLRVTAVTHPVAAAHGIEAGGAVLVRPDGYVAWRTVSRPHDPATALTEALCTILDRPTP